jgi:hypothetical protein
MAFQMGQQLDAQLLRNPAARFTRHTNSDTAPVVHWRSWLQDISHQNGYMRKLSAKPFAMEGESTPPGVAPRRNM